jgi:NEDD4-binding protein 2
MKKLIIIRGPSGSGKSTLAHKLLGSEYDSGVDERVFEADHFFYKNGTYQFDAAKLGQAHGDCQHRVRAAMERDEELLVVSNTSMTRWELNPYLAFAKEFGYEVKVYRIKGPWDAKLFASRNAHGVSIEVVQKQINKYQPLESEEEYAGE